MDINSNIIKYYFKQKTPIDLRIVVYITYAIGLFSLVSGFLLLTPFARLGENGFTILFGTVRLYNKFFCAMYLSVIGFLHLLCAHGLMKRLKLAWWILLIINLYGLLNYPFSYSEYSKNQINTFVLIWIFIWIFINITIIIWLFLRRKLFVKKVD